MTYLVTMREEDAGVFEEEVGKGEGEDDDVGEEVAGSEVAAGEADVAGDGEGEVEKVCDAGGGEEGVREGEVTAGGLDASEVTAGAEGVGWEGAGTDEGTLSAVEADALAWWKARAW